jgi:hypothetical protein
MALSKTTQDHDTIRKWAEARRAMPAEVASTAKGKQTGILRFAFPKAKNHKDENLEEISWDEFFEKFDQNGLELIYQEKTAEGAQSNFNKLIYPEDEHASGKSRSSSSRTSATSSRGSGSASKGGSTRSISSGRSASAKGGSSKASSSSRGSTAGRSTSTGRGSSSSRAGTSSSGRSTSTRKKAA